jgi:hypothetical protein
MMPFRLLEPQEAALLLGTTTATLADWRFNRSGPAFVKVGHLVRYQLRDLTDYMMARRVEPGRS